MTSQLEQLAELSTIVADTGEIEAIKQFRPTDCTTNPTLLLKAVQIPEYASLVNEAIAWGSGRTHSRASDIETVMDRLAVTFGREMLGLVPGYVSTEVDASLSFDTQGSIDKARHLIAMYRELGVDANRVLIKLASTWEGIEAARVLQREGIRCNMTLIFSLAQAVACANAGAHLVSPFVGRITDWYKANHGETYTAENDPGVQSVRNIYNYFKAHGIGTVVMAASFRTTDQVLGLAGCDRLTIAPQLLDELASTEGEVTRALDPSRTSAPDSFSLDEKTFRWELSQDPMATEKLAEGIRRFHDDANKLRATIDAII